MLEIGCGEEKPLSKILTGGAAARVNTYTGVDLNKLKPSNSKRLTFIGEFNFVKDWKQLEREGGYDVAVHLEVIEHMKVIHGRKLLKGCFNLLKPGGIMVMSTPCYDGKRHAANHIHEYTVPELQKEAEKAGFVVERRFGTFMDIKHIGKVPPTVPDGKPYDDTELMASIARVHAALKDYYDNDALSNFFGPLYPDHARNNIWICRRPA